MNLNTLHYLDTIRNILSPYPGIEEYSCFGTPAFRVKKKLLARLKEDGETLAVRCWEREVWMRARPDIFFITEHYRNYPTVLVRLVKVNSSDLEKILTGAWREIAPKKIIKEFDEK